MREFDFSQLGNSDSQEIPVVKALSVAGMTEGTLLVRVHSGNWDTGGSNDKIEVLAYTTAPSAEDPSNDFIAASAVGTITITQSDTDAPSLEKASLSSNFGAMLRITVRGTQADTAVTNLKATLSAELVVKD